MPALDIAVLRAYCERRPCRRARSDQVRVEAVDDHRVVTIVERRAPWRPDYAPEWTTSPIARPRYTASRRQWTLYWRDRNQHWRRYPDVKPTGNVTELLDEIDRGPTGIFRAGVHPLRQRARADRQRAPRLVPVRQGRERVHRARLAVAEPVRRELRRSDPRRAPRRRAVLLSRRGAGADRGLAPDSTTTGPTPRSG